MKRIVLALVLAVVASASIFGQNIVPQGMKYQAVARSLSGELLTNRQVSIQISLLSMTADAQTFYSETHSTTTNNLGLFDLTIGQGKTVFGEFALIPWASEEVWIDFKLDTDNSGNFKTVSTSRLLAVPYAFHAATAGEIADGATGQASTEACGAGSATGTLWSTKANCATTADAKLGTADLKPVKLVTNFIERILIQPDGKVFMREDVKMDKDLLVVDQTTVGRLHITGENDGDGDDFDSFSLQMDGSSQGAAIKVDGTVSGDRVFIACFDDNGLKGSISGQTQAELYASPEYIIQHTAYALETVAIAADIVGLVIEAAGAAAAAVEAAVTIVLIPLVPGFTAEAAGVVAQIVGVTAKGIELALEWIAFGVIQDSSVDGIVLNSADADYAEWLERANPSVDLLPGQIVGVKGGKISLETNGADHVMAISTAPIVLGNMPAKGKEMLFEKVAFMGQVPVRVVGQARIGDFILASGNADGYAVAVSPDKMKLEDYDRIVGVAWEASMNSLTSLLNVAVDINTNDMADRIAEQARKVERLEAQMSEIYASLKGETPPPVNANPTKVSGASAPVADLSKIGSLPSFGYTEEMLRKNGPTIEAKMKELLAQFQRQGLHIETLPAEARAILDNPVQALKDVEAGKYNRTFTEQLYKNQVARKAAARSGK